MHEPGKYPGRDRRIYPEAGTFFSNRFNPLLILEEDTVGAAGPVFASAGAASRVVAAHRT